MLKKKVYLLHSYTGEMKACVYNKDLYVDIQHGFMH